MGNSKVWRGNMPSVEGIDMTRRNEHRRWSALDPSSAHPLDRDMNNLEGTIENIQESYEQIIVIDSADVEITTTDTQAALSLQVALQAAISLVISISIGGSSRDAERITQELIANVKSKQINRQQTYVENSRGVRITTTDNDLIVNIQLLLQILIALLVRIDVL